MKITAVVVTYNRLNLLKHGIECLKKQDKLSEIIVVNNGSTDGTGEWLSAATTQSNGDSAKATPTAKTFKVINQENVGGSGGFYTGIQAAYDDGADWIWCMDDDVFPREDCLDRLVEHIGKSDTGILAPRRILDGKVFCHEFRQFNFSNPFASMHGKKLKIDGRLNAGYSHDENKPSSPITQHPTPITQHQSAITHHPTPNTQHPTPIQITGCDFEGPFISRKVVEKIGLPNKELFIFCDDTDYCLRAHLAGFKAYYVPDAILDKHKFFSDDTWTTRNQKKKWKRFYQVRNETYMSHHYGKNWAVRYLRGFIMVLGYWIPAVLSMPFTNAWSMKDLPVLWQAYKDGINERLGKRN